MAKQVGKDGEEDELHCSVCLELYEDPRVLPCLHTFCLKCLTKLAIGKIVKCPACRMEHQISLRGVSGFLSNSRVKSDVELVRFREATSRTCGMCEDVSEIVGFCNECLEPLCASCNVAHKRMVMFKNHDVVAPNKARFKAKVTAFPCPIHTEEFLKVYCAKCEVVVCHECVLYSHQDHTLLPAEEAVSSIHQQISVLEIKVQQKLEEFQRYAEDADKVQDHLTAHPDTLKKEIAATFDGLSKELEKRKRVLLNEVDSQYDTFTKQAGEEKDAINMTICGLQASKSFSARVKQSSVGLEQAILGAQAISHIKQMVASSWKPETMSQLRPLLFSPSSSSGGVINPSGHRKKLPIYKGIPHAGTSHSRSASVVLGHTEYIQSIGKIFHVSKFTLHLSQLVTSANSHRARCSRSSECVIPLSSNSKYFCHIVVQYSSSVEVAVVFEKAAMTSFVTRRTEQGSVLIPSEVRGSFAACHFVLEFCPQRAGEYTITATVSVGGKVCGCAVMETKFADATNSEQDRCED